MEHKEEILSRNRAWKLAHKDLISIRNKEHTKKLRYQVLSHYSGSDQPFCKQCGHSDIRALCIDHINNDGVSDRKVNGKAQAFLRYLIRNSYPEGYQILCANCNLVKEIERR